VRREVLMLVLVLMLMLVLVLVLVLCPQGRTTLTLLLKGHQDHSWAMLLLLLRTTLTDPLRGCNRGSRLCLLASLDL